MATFCIHEDKENCYKHTFHHTKQFFKNLRDKKVSTKKLESRVTFQCLSNGIKHDAKRVKFAGNSKVEAKQNKLKADPKAVKCKKSTLDDSFCKIEKQNDVPREKENEKDNFPLSLYHNEEYRKDIWRYLTQAESEGPRSKSNYMLKQVDLSWNTRSVLVDWLASVGDEYKFCDQTFYLSVNYVDRFLNLISVTRNKFQLLGAAAMMIASKMEEYQALDAQEWSYLTGDAFTPRQVLKMEQLILKVLRFKMQPPTTHAFIQHLSTENKMDPKTVHLAMYICELALLEGEDYIEHFPSKLASAAIVLARHTLFKSKPWPEKLQKTSGYSLRELSPVVQRQQTTFRNSPHKEQQAIQTKYKSERYNKVALLKPRVLVMQDFDEE